MFSNLLAEIDSYVERDPALRSRLEVALCYPGFHALVFHRMANAAWRRGWHLLGRFVSHLGRLFTGIEIHPGARIGRSEEHTSELQSLIRPSYAVLSLQKQHTI